MPKVLIAITENMVKAGLKVLERAIEDVPEDSEEVHADGAEPMTDVQTIIQIFTAMWQTKMAEEAAIRRGKAIKPKVVPIRNGLLLPAKH